MPRSADIVVVGGGIMGTAIALRLAQHGAGRVCLVEKRHFAAGSSGKSGAILRQHYSHRETVRMAREGLHFYRDFQARFGIDIGFRRHGMIFLVDPRDREALIAHVELQIAEGVPTRVVGEDDLASIEERGYYEADALGCYEEDAGSVDPRRAVEGLAQAAGAAGVITSVGETITGLRREGTTIRGVESTHGPIDAGHVVLATGPWTLRLLRAAGLPAPPLEVVRPQQAFLEPPARFGDPHPIFADLRLGAYWKTEGPRHTRVGSVSTADDEVVDDPDVYDESASGAFVRRHRDIVAGRIPAYGDATIWGGCGALYTMTPDSHPVLGPVPGWTGLTLVAGFSGHGFKLAPAVAQGVAEWIVDGAPRAFPADFFSLDRFDQGRRIQGGYRYGLLG